MHFPLLYTSQKLISFENGYLDFRPFAFQIDLRCPHVGCHRATVGSTAGGDTVLNYSRAVIGRAGSRDLSRPLIGRSHLLARHSCTRWKPRRENTCTRLTLGLGSLTLGETEVEIGADTRPASCMETSWINL